MGADLAVGHNPAEVAEDGYRHLPAPIKEEDPLLPDAREARDSVVRRLSSLAKQLRRYPAYKGRYTTGMRDLRALGCAVDVTVDDVGRNVAPSDQDVLLFPWCPDRGLDAEPKPCSSMQEKDGRRIQYLSEKFWSRWRKEYLLSLNKCQKKCRSQRLVGTQ